MTNTATSINPQADNPRVLLARQSILDEHSQLYGFEVLYRGTTYDITQSQDGMGATQELLSNVYTSILDEVALANRKIFINVDEQFIHSPSFFPSHSTQIVLEILETVPATPKVLEKIKSLRTQGFEFALDDYVFEPGREAFLPLVSYVKIDVLECSIEKVEEKIKHLRNFPFRLLAEKVENQQVFDQYKALGFELFQGYFLERPKLVHGTKVPASQQVTLKLLSELTRDDISVDEVTDLIICDPRMAMKILLLVNSSLFAFVRKISNVREAVVLLGIEAVKKWAIVLLLISDSQQPIELFRTLLSRAKALELYAVSAGKNNPNDYFSLGLFSGIDAALGIEMGQVTACLHLDPALIEALNFHSGDMGELLSTLQMLERQTLDDSVCAINRHLLDSTYWQGLVWADELLDSVL